MYSVKAESKFKIGVNKNFYISKFAFVREPGGSYVEIEFTSKDGSKVSTRKYEPTKGYGDTAEEKAKSIITQQARLASYLVSTVAAYVPFSTIKEKVEETSSLEDFTNGLKKLLPKDANKVSVDLFLVRDEKGYYKLPPTTRGLSTNSYIAKSEENIEIEPDEYFTKNYLDKYSMVKNTGDSPKSATPWVVDEEDEDDDLPWK
jgi:hypothetical protein